VAAGASATAGESELQAFFLTTSWCGQRLDRWPNARDAESAIKSIRQDMANLVDKIDPADFLSASDEAISEGLDLRIIAEQVSLLRDKQNFRAVNSPLFAEFAKAYPHISLRDFENVYNKQGQKFVQSGIYILRREFKNNPPSGLAPENLEHWKKIWPQYLPPQLLLWQKNLKSIETRMRMAQRAWKESISSQTPSTESM